MVNRRIRLQGDSTKPNFVNYLHFIGNSYLVFLVIIGLLASFNAVAQPAMPAGFSSSTPAPGANPGAVFLSCGPNDAGVGDVVYRLFYSETASAPADPTTATEYTFGSTGGDGSGVNPFGFNLTGLLINTNYTFWLYQYDTGTTMFSAPAVRTQDSGDVGPPAMPVGFVSSTPSGTNGEIFVAVGPNQTSDPDIRYRLFYSPTSSAPADPTTATEYTFGSTAGDGGGVNAFGFRLMGLIPDEPYTIWLYQYNDVSMLFSAPAIQATSASLPVEWQDPLEAKVNDDGIQLSWSVSQQINNEAFVVQHSPDGTSFEDVEVIEGAGSTGELIQYRYHHQDPFSGYNYYRIQQIDFDGSYDFSNVAAVKFDGGDPALVYPNPTAGDLSIETTYRSTVKVVDLLGRVVKTATLEVGINSLDIFELDRGIYSLVFQDGSIEAIVKQ